MRVVYIGMLGAFSAPPLRALLDAAIDVCAVVVPAVLPGAAPLAPLAPPRRPTGLLDVHAPVEQHIAQIAWDRAIPVFELRRARAPETRAAFAALNAMIGCVACFPQRLPADLLAVPQHGFLNVHPSLLPRGRGPEPLFWTLRNGEQAGVTLHAMSAQLDAGDIVAQAPVALPDGASGAAVERRCATVGGALLVAALRALECGALPRRPQPEGGSYDPAPIASDFTISPTWSARRVFNFMRATAAWGEPYALEVCGTRLMLRAALDYYPDAVLDAPYTQHGDEVAIQCAPGVVRARLA